MWSFVGRRGCTRWAWAALDLGTRQVVAMVVGDRPEATARRLWAALPATYRDGAVFRTDLWPSYLAVVPRDRHARGGRGAGLTCHVERFWLTLRQRCGRFVRRSLSFSKCPRNHLGALWYFTRHYNASLR